MCLLGSSQGTADALKAMGLRLGNRLQVQVGKTVPTWRLSAQRPQAAKVLLRAGLQRKQVAVGAATHPQQALPRMAGAPLTIAAMQALRTVTAAATRSRAASLKNVTEEGGLDENGDDDKAMSLGNPAGAAYYVVEQASDPDGSVDSENEQVSIPGNGGSSDWEWDTDRPRAIGRAKGVIQTLFATKGFGFRAGGGSDHGSFFPRA